MRSVGLKNYTIRIGHIGILRGFWPGRGGGGTAAPILQKLDKKEYEEASARMAEAGISAEEARG